jgi:hypothetical protein
MLSGCSVLASPRRRARGEAPSARRALSVVQPGTFLFDRVPNCAILDAGGCVVGISNPSARRRSLVRVDGGGAQSEPCR